MEKMWRFYSALLLISIMTVTHIQYADACSCALDHTQTDFCNADFVAHVKVRKSKWDNNQVHNPIYKIYKVKIIEIFKASEKAAYALTNDMQLWTASSDSLCGLEMKPGNWVVSGRMVEGNPTVSLCDIAMPWSTVTSIQRKSFRKFYAKGCSCKIKSTTWSNKGNSLKPDRCLWESLPGPFDCQDKYGICIPKQDGCFWKLSKAYKQCVMKHQQDQRYGEQQRAREP